MRNKITAKLIGPSELFTGFHNFGLCNQMFQIATILSYAHDYDFDAIFPGLKNSHYGNYTKNIFRNLIIDEDMPNNYSWYVEPKYSYQPIPKRDESFAIRDSYFQSEKYFTHNRKLILDTFAPQDEDIEYIRAKYENILLNEKTVSCHVRRGDYTQLENAHPHIWETDYYDKALEEIDYSMVLVFSDDMEYCKEKFKNINATFIHEKDYLDLYIMSMCENNIIANSSFSWWGAWLNQNPDKKVIVPMEWFGNDKPHGGRGGHTDGDLIPDGWIKL